ncbi:MAG: hypothetical protein LUF85_09815 [Bacteroides sp.]|nr:hypothetical protein [Bacteroides sp.]
MNFLFNKDAFHTLFETLDPYLYNQVVCKLAHHLDYEHLPQYDMCSQEEIWKEYGLYEKAPYYSILYIHNESINETIELTFLNGSCIYAKVYKLADLNLEKILGTYLYAEVCNSIEYYKKYKKRLPHSFSISKNKEIQGKI